MELTLTVQPVTEEIMADMEERNLIKRILPSEQVLNIPEGTIEVDRVYETDAQFGSHMLICIGFNKSIVEMAYHSDNEDFILINEGREQKPLILIIALHSVEELHRLISTSQLTADDLLALDLTFNDPRLSFFTMNSFTPHCEWTVPGPGPANVFYVTEPNNLDMQPISLGEYTINIDYPSEVEG